MAGPLPFDIRPMPRPIDDDLRARAIAAEPATIGHFKLLGFPCPAIRPLVPMGWRVVGTAVTLALPGADSTLLHHAMSLIRAGDILLIDRLGDTRHACLGGGLSVALSRAGVEAAIVDGPCADPFELEASGVAIFGTGVSSITTRLLGVGGAMNVPVCIGGAVVMPGDLVIADDGGIVIVGIDEADAVIDRAVQMQAWEHVALADMGPAKPLGEISGASAKVAAVNDAA